MNHMISWQADALRLQSSYLPTVGKYGTVLCRTKAISEKASSVIVPEPEILDKRKPIMLHPARAILACLPLQFLPNTELGWLAMFPA